MTGPISSTGTVPQLGRFHSIIPTKRPNLTSDITLTLTLFGPFMEMIEILSLVAVLAQL